MIILFSKKQNETKFRYAVMRWVGIGCFVVAVSLAFLTFVMTLPEVQARFQDVLDYFDKVEYFIAGLNRFWAFVVIIFLFAVKIIVPVVPLSVLFIASGMVFPVPVAAAINVLGFSILVSAKFFWGRKFGGGGAHKFLIKSDWIMDFMKLGGDGNKWMLAILRFVPNIPIGTVSRIYGATSMDWLTFVLFSVLGYLPRLISWSVIGCNYANPFSFAFTAPIIMLLVISGISILLLNTLISLVKKNKEKDVLK